MAPTCTPIHSLRISLLGLVPKKTPWEFRLIHPVSHLHGNSENVTIDPAICRVKYTFFDVPVDMVRALGPSAVMAKCDSPSAFSLLSGHPDDFDLLGFIFQGSYYFNKALTMGCSISCAAFECFSTFLQWCVTTRDDDRNLTHYLDDFLLMGQFTGLCITFILWK